MEIYQVIQRNFFLKLLRLPLLQGKVRKEDTVIIAYKPQGQTNEAYPQLIEKSFVIMTNFQTEMCDKHSNHLVCIDSTHNIYISLQIQASHNCCSWWVLKWYNTCIPLPFFPSLHLPHYHPFLLPLSPLSLNVFLWMYNHVYACMWMLHVHTHTHTLRIHIWLWRTWLTVAGKSHDIPIQAHDMSHDIPTQVTWHVTCMPTKVLWQATWHKV